MTIHLTTTNQVNDWLKEGKAMLIDVREPAEYTSEHIEGARSMPLATVSSKLLQDSKAQHIVFQCQSGRRSHNACEVIIKENPSAEVWNMEGGLNSWKEAGLPTHKGKHQIIPLDRQVQITAGLLVLAGALLGYFANIHFIWLSAFIGVGLFQAGITGWCGLAKLMAIMPWNQLSGSSCSINTCKGE
tara:strand:- start:760 stop:1320 length:561 start_codon:yes stop_codon:yes gene_type:complete